MARCSALGKVTPGKYCRCAIIPNFKRSNGKSSSSFLIVCCTASNQKLHGGKGMTTKLAYRTWVHFCRPRVVVWVRCSCVLISVEKIKSCFFQSERSVVQLPLGLCSCPPEVGRLINWYLYYTSTWMCLFMQLLGLVLHHPPCEIYSSDPPS